MAKASNNEINEYFLSVAAALNAQLQFLRLLTLQDSERGYP